MASTNEIAQIEAINKALTGLNTTINGTAESCMKVVKISDEWIKSSKNIAQTTENLNKAQKEAVKISNDQQKIDKELEKVEKQLNQVGTEAYKILQQKKIALKDENDKLRESITGKKAAAEEEKRLNAERRESEKQIKAATIAQEKANKVAAEKARVDALAETSLTKMRMRLKELTKEYDDSANPTKKLTNEINSLSKKIEEAEKATNRHQRGVGSYKEKIMEVAKEFIGFAGAIGIAIAVVDKLKDAFAESEGGVRFFKKLSEASTTFFQNMLHANTSMIGVNTIIATQLAGKLDDLRLEERYEKLKVANLDTEVKLLRLKAAGTKDLTIQRELYIEADKKEDESIAIRKEHLGKEIEIMQQLLVLRPQDSKLRDELTQKNVEIIQIEGDKNLRIQTKLAATAEKIEQQKEAAIKRAEEAAKRSFEARVTAVETTNEREKAIINKRHIDGLTTEETYQDQLIIQEIKYLNTRQALYKVDSKEYAEIEVQKQEIFIKDQDDKLKKLDDNLKLQKTIEDDFNDEAERRLKENADFEEQLAKEQADLERELLKKKEQEEVATAAKIKQLKIDLAFAAVNAVFEMNKNKLDSELNDLDKKREKELSNKNLTEAQKAKIEADYQKKANAIKTKQAQNDKNQALFNATMNTAVEITKHLGNPIMIALIAALGAIQIGLIASKPIPKFKLGTKDAPEKGIFGEAGRELMSLRSGGLMMADKATYFEGSKFKGARIFSNPETERLIKETDKRGYQMSDDRILAGLNDVKKAILQKPVAIYDTNHKQIGIGNSKHQEIYLNRLTR